MNGDSVFVINHLGETNQAGLLKSNVPALLLTSVSVTVTKRLVRRQTNSRDSRDFVDSPVS